MPSLRPPQGQEFVRPLFSPPPPRAPFKIFDLFHRLRGISNACSADCWMNGASGMASVAAPIF